MKCLAKRIVCVFFVLGILSTLFCTNAFARSSAYLNSYRAVITPKSGGKLVVTADITGVGRMSEIGVKTIYMYESENGTDFTRVKIYRSSAYPKMMGSGTSFYEDVVTHQGTPGYYYCARVYVYAANENGSDEKTYETAIVQAIP